MKRKILITIKIALVVFICAFLSTCYGSQSSEINRIYVFEGSTNAGVYKTQPTEMELEIDLPTMPDQLKGYQVIKPNIDDKYARDLANKLGFVDEWPLYGGKRVAYSYTKDGQSLEINLEGGLTISREHTISVTPPNIPEDAVCIKIARDWLITNDLYPADVVRIEVGYIGSGSKIDPQTGQFGETIHYSKGVSFITSINGYETYVPGAMVIVGDQGEIVQSSIIITTYKESGIVTLKTSQAALEILKAYLSRLTPSAEETPECVYNVDGTRVIIKNVSIKYVRTFKTDYMLPVYVFEGDAYRGTDSIPEKFRGSVDAQVHQNP